MRLPSRTNPPARRKLLFVALPGAVVIAVLWWLRGVPSPAVQREPIRDHEVVRLGKEPHLPASPEAASPQAEAQFQSWWKGVESQLASGHPLAQMTLPTLAAVQRKMQQTRVERTLLGAGLEVLQHGPAQLARYRDPATGNALLYVPTPSGFDLRSTYQVKGKPVTMFFSAPR